MSTLGKVLLVVNLLAAIAVAYFAASTWAARQESNAKLVTYHLYRVGMPHEAPAAAGDEVTIDVRMGSGPTLTKLDKKILTTYFGKPDFPTSRKEAVEKLGKDYISRMQGDAAQNPQKLLDELIGYTTNTGTFYPGTLVLLADSFEERAAYKELLSKPGVQSAATAINYFQAKFTAATSAPGGIEDPAKLRTARQKVDTARTELQTKLDALGTRQTDYQKLAGDPKSDEQALNRAKIAYNGAVEDVSKAETALLDANREFNTTLINENKSAFSELDRRRRVAALLLCVDRGPTGQSLAIKMLGQKDYLAALYDRINRLGEMPRRYDREKDYAETRFVILYDQKRKAAQDLAQLADVQKKLADSLDVAVQKSTELVNQRTTQRDEAKKAAENVEKVVTEGIQAQAVAEGELFALQQKVGLLLRDNYDLEEQLRQKEKGGK